MSFQTDGVIPWGRSFQDYRDIFGLTDADLPRRILDCAGGPAAFNAEWTARGGRVVSVDPLYQSTGAEIARRLYDRVPELHEQLRAHAGCYHWGNRFRDSDDLIRQRLAALEQFLTDYPVGSTEGRYVTDELPDLRLGNRSFDLAICSHLLFSYSDRFDEEFHRRSVVELLRVADEVRVFPLVDLTGKPSPHVGAVTEEVRGLGATAEVVSVGYEFQRGGNRMLKVTRGPCPRP